MTVIFKVNKELAFILIFLTARSAAHAQDLNSFCFNKTVNLQHAKASLNFLLVPKDIVELDIQGNCLDIVTSGDRGKLFEKFLSKRYDLIRETKSEERAECRLKLKTTKKSIKDSTTLKVGEKNNLNSSETMQNSVSTMDLLLGAGYPGELEIGSEKLKVVCQLSGLDMASLTFSISDKQNVSTSTHLF